MIKKSIVLVFLVFTCACFAGNQRASIFLNKEDISRIRANVEQDAFFARLAQNKINTAKSIRTQNMPEFNNDWWKEYQGAEYVNGINRHITRENQRIIPLRYGNSARDLAIAYILTENEEFAVKAKSILIDMTELEFVHVDVNSGLDYSSSVFPAIEAYDIIYDYFTESEHSRMREFFYALVDTVGQCSDFWIANEPAGVPISNHDGWHHVCFTMVGLFYQDQELIDRGIKGAKGFEVALKYGFEDDGVWLEASLPYHFIQLGTMLRIAEMSYVSGYKDLYSYSNDDGLSLAQIYGSAVDIVFPDGLLPPIGDGYGELIYPSTYGEYELLYLRTGDQRFAYLLNMNKQRSSDALLWGAGDISTDFVPDTRSRLWPQHGYAALRTQEGKDYWNGKGYSVFASFSNNNTHHHADGLSVMLFSDNHLWLRDSEAHPGRAERWGSEFNQMLNWTTMSHNTVVVDRENQVRNPKPLDLIEFTVLPEAKRLCMGDLNGHLYEGVRQMRTIIATDDYVLDVFEVAADSERDIAWVTHIDADENQIFQTKWQQSQWIDQTPWSFLKGKEISSKAESFWETFTQDGKHFRIDLIVDNQAKYIKTNYPTTQGKYIPMRMIEADGVRRAMFAAVYRVSSEPITSPIEINIKKGIGENIEILFQRNGRRFSHRVSSLSEEAEGVSP
jgi:hypothetical protein